MWRWLWPLLLFALVMALPTEGGGSGDYPPPESGDWVIANATAVWDEQLVIDGSLTIQPSGSLTLQNVTLYVRGKVTVEGPAVWENATLFIERSRGRGGLDVNDLLWLRNTTLRLNLTAHPEDQDNEQRIVVNDGGNFTVSDYDDNPATWHDASLVTDGAEDDDEANPRQEGTVNFRFRFKVNNGGSFSLVNSELSEVGWNDNWGNPQDRSKAGLYIDTPDVRIEGSVIHHGHYGMVVDRYGDRLVLRNSTLRDMGETGIFFWYTSGPYNSPDNWRIEGNLFDVPQYGILNYARYGELRNNTFRNGGTALYSYWTANWGSVSGNLFRNLNTGVILFHADNWVITNNTFEDLATAGITLQGGVNNVAAANNTFRECGYGFYLIPVEQTWGSRDHYYVPLNILLRDNLIEDCVTGLGVNGLGSKNKIPDGGTNIVVEANIINNVTTGVTLQVGSATPDTFQAIAFRNNEVQGLTGFDFNGGEGVFDLHHNRFATLVGGVVRDSTRQRIENNTFTNLTIDGLTLTTSQEMRVSNNSFDGGHDGLVVEGGSDNLLHDNRLSNLSRAGLVVRDGADANLSRNRVTNATIGLALEATTLRGWNNTFDGVAWAYYHLDVNLTPGDDHLVAVGGLVWKAWSCRVFANNSYDAKVRDRPFEVRDSRGVVQASDKTGSDGYSPWFALTVSYTQLNLTVEQRTPHTVEIEHQGVIVSVSFTINYTTTLGVRLDVIAPVSKLEVDGVFAGGTYLVNQAWFVPRWNLTDGSEDLLDFSISYSAHDGNGFGPWVLWGNFTNLSAPFPGQDGVLYRLRSLARDIYGNVEAKLGGYDVEVRVDLTPPASLLWIVEDPGPVTRLEGLTLKWELEEAGEYVTYTVAIQYLVGTTPSGWSDLLRDTTATEQWFVPPLDRTYQFRVLATDRAGNREVKSGPEATVRFDRQPPTVTLERLPTEWGNGTLPLTLTEASEPLATLGLQWASISEATLDSLGEGMQQELAWSSNLALTWENGSAEFTGLHDGFWYYFRLLPTDTAGNPAERDPVELLLDSDGSANQTFAMPVAILPHALGDGLAVRLAVRVDEDGDGLYERLLEEGSDPAMLTASQYFVDYDARTLILGDNDTGYQPAAGDERLQVTYAGYDGRTLVDMRLPGAARELDYTLTGNTTVRLQWRNTDEAVEFRVERTTNATLGWELLGTVAPDESGYTQFTDEIEQFQLYLYRVVTIDRMGYEKASDPLTVDLTVADSGEEIVVEPDSQWIAWALALGLALIGLTVAAVYGWRHRSGAVAPGPEGTTRRGSGRRGSSARQRGRNGRRAAARQPVLEAQLEPLAQGVAETVLPPTEPVAVEASAVAGAAETGAITAAEPSPFTVPEDSEFARGPQLVCSGCGVVFARPEGETATCDGCGTVGTLP